MKVQTAFIAGAQQRAVTNSASGAVTLKSLENSCRKISRIEYAKDRTDIGQQEAIPEEYVLDDGSGKSNIYLYSNDGETYIRQYTGKCVVAPVSEGYKHFAHRACNCPVLIMYLADKAYKPHIAVCHLTGFVDPDKQLDAICKDLASKELLPLEIIYRPRFDSSPTGPQTKVKEIEGFARPTNVKPDIKTRHNKDSSIEVFVNEDGWFIIDTSNESHNEGGTWKTKLPHQ